jgi:hypothetical protein
MDISLIDILGAFWPVILIILSALLGAHSTDEPEEQNKNKLREKDYSDYHRNKRIDKRPE